MPSLQYNWSWTRCSSYTERTRTTNHGRFLISLMCLHPLGGDKLHSLHSNIRQGPVTQWACSLSFHFLHRIEKKTRHSSHVLWHSNFPFIIIWCLGVWFLASHTEVACCHIWYIQPLFSHMFLSTSFLRGCDGVGRGVGRGLHKCLYYWASKARKLTPASLLYFACMNRNWWMSSVHDDCFFPPESCSGEFIML